MGKPESDVSDLDKEEKIQEPEVQFKNSAKHKFKMETSPLKKSTRYDEIESDEDARSQNLGDAGRIADEEPLEE